MLCKAEWRGEFFSFLSLLLGTMFLLNDWLAWVGLNGGNLLLHFVLGIPKSFRTRVGLFAME
jgi:hypothetical protein